MWVPRKHKGIRHIFLFVFFLILFVVLVLAIAGERLVEPVIRNRLHTLIIKGSDSLYQYTLGGLDASFFGGNVEVENLQITMDTGRFQQLAASNSLPSLTMELTMGKGHIKGIGLFSLFFNKQINITEILSRDAQIRFLRHAAEDTGADKTPPLWKAIRPAIRGIEIDKINLEGVKLLYRYADTSQSLKLQFDTCHAQFRGIRIDSAASMDASRIGFAREVNIRFRDLKFRTADSSLKMKAEEISYSSKDGLLQVSDFKIQPTLKEKEAFYRAVGVQKSMQVITFDKMTFTRFQLDRFFHKNVIMADSVLVQKPVFAIYMDKTYPAPYQNKIGQYPHQKLLNASAAINIKGVALQKANLTYIEKAKKTGAEGKFTLTDLDIAISNVTNDPAAIRKNGKCIATLKGGILGNSPFAARFVFHLDSADGRFDADGEIRDVKASQLNALSQPLANIKIQSFDLHRLTFAIAADDYTARGRITMRYNNLFLVFQKQDEETGVLTTKKLLTRVINRFTIHQSNPGEDGRERVAANAVRARLSFQGFSGLLWKTIFAGMQTIMIKNGRYE